MHYTPLTKPTSYEENHNITNSDLKQKSKWKSYKKTKLQDCELSVRERTTNPWSIAYDINLIKIAVEM